MECFLVANRVIVYTDHESAKKIALARFLPGDLGWSPLRKKMGFFLMDPYISGTFKATSDLTSDMNSPHPKILKTIF